MKKRWTLAGLFVILLMQPFLLADRQWLQYRNSAHTKDIIGGGSRYIRPEIESPDSKALPESDHTDPVFFKWKCPMDTNGFRWVMLDKKEKHGRYDTLYVDSNGDGILNDEVLYTGSPGSSYRIQFDQVPVYFQGEDGLITYHLNLLFSDYQGRDKYLYVQSGCWYEGKVLINGEPKRCVLMDYNCNGTFDDKSENLDSDRIFIGPEQGADLHYVGNFLEFDGKLYRFSVAQDGAFVEINSAEDVAYGTVTLPESITSFSAAGMNGMFERTVENGKVMLPVGQYRISSWVIARKDKKGVEWQLQGSGFPKGSEFKVKADTAVNLDIGEPIISRLDANSRKDVYSFNQSLIGKSGERISLMRAGRRTEAPKVHVRNKTGEYDRTFTLEYG